MLSSYQPSKTTRRSLPSLPVCLFCWWTYSCIWITCTALSFAVVNCSDPGFVENAVRHEQQNFPESFEYGTSVVYHCKKGFYLLGSSALTCMANGLWDRSLPKCLGKWGSFWPQSPVRTPPTEHSIFQVFKTVLIFNSLYPPPSQIIFVIMTTL